jgi:transmembrane sensor
MGKLIKKLADKFFKDQCTPEEAEKVLEWLETEEGQNYLDEKIEKDFDTLDDGEPLNANGVDSDKLFRNVLNRIERFGFRKTRRTNFLSPLLQVAAGLLIVVAGSLFYLIDSYSDASENKKEVLIFITGEDEQREVRLSDGTLIRMNSNSELAVSPGYMNRDRTVSLNGEAFFDVVSRENDPFLINTGGTEVEVLGTSFNINSLEGSNRVKVAVTDGKVAFRGVPQEESLNVILQKGDFAYWDSVKSEMTVEHFGADNYMAWMSGEFIFDDLPITKVCVQLQRFYEIGCEFREGTIRDLRLTANFPSTSLENTLSVIGLSLKLNYEKRGGKVLWSLEKKSN